MALSYAVSISLAIAIAGWWMRALSPRGALAATGVGTSVLFHTGTPGMLALGSFFLTSSLLSRLSPDPGAALDAKGSTRDQWQVLANGGAAAVGAMLPGAGLWIVTTSLAAAAADTWATSLGGWSRIAPRHILTLQRVLPGTSGGITLVGTLGGVMGALVVGLGPALSTGALQLLPVALGIGLVGMLSDSLLGATLQGKFHCDVCDRATERRIHRCGNRNRRTGGFSWLGNDAVNALATGFAALLGWLAWHCWAA
ncbi:MAG: DUF92 domain-containing protein [Gemmatimonadota bacterium]